MSDINFISYYNMQPWLPSRFTCPHDPFFRHVIHKNLSPALFQASAEIKIRSAFFWDFRQRRMVVSEQPIGTIFKSQAVMYP